MDPQLLMALLPLLMQGGGSGGSNPLSALMGGSGGNGLSALESLFSGKFSPSSLPSLFGGEIGSLISGLFGGVPNTQKTLGVESGLASSGNPIAQMLADYVQNGILGKGNVLSSPGGAGFGKMAQMLEWLSGDSLPGLRSGEATIGGNPVPVPRDISRLNAMLGQSPNLSPSEIQAFLPQIESMVSGGGTLKGLSGQIEAMINSVSGQKKAGIGGGNPSGGGNPLATIFGGGGGGGGSNPSAINQLLEHFKTMSGGNSGNLVGTSA
jgi:hypothetical protein